MNAIHMMIDYYVDQLKALNAIEKGNWKIDHEKLNIIAWDDKDK